MSKKHECTCSPDIERARKKVYEQITKLTKDHFLSTAKFDGDGAEMTCRLIPGDDDFENPEWAEHCTFEGVECRVLYRTTPDDAIMAEGSDWSAIDWDQRCVAATIVDDPRIGRTDEEQEQADRLAARLAEVDW